MRSDFHAIHGLMDPMEQLDSATYWEWAERLPGYPGVLRTLLEAEANEAELAKQQGRAPAGSPVGRSRAVGSPQGQEAPATARDLEADPATKGLFDY